LGIREYPQLVDKFISAVVYRHIIIQKNIHILIAKQNNILDEMDQNRNPEISIDQLNTSTVSMSTHTFKNGVMILSYYKKLGSLFNQFKVFYCGIYSSFPYSTAITFYVQC